MAVSLSIEGSGHGNYQRIDDESVSRDESQCCDYDYLHDLWGAADDLRNGPERQPANYASYETPEGDELRSGGGGEPPVRFVWSQGKRDSRIRSIDSGDE